MKNQIKKNKTIKQKQKNNIVVGHPDGEKRTLVPNLEGPDVLCAPDSAGLQKLGGQDEAEAHGVIDDWMIYLGLTVQGEWHNIVSEDEHSELDKMTETFQKREAWVEKRYDPKEWLEEEENVMVLEEVPYEEWMVKSLERIYFPQEETSKNCVPPTKNEGRGKKCQTSFPGTGKNHVPFLLI